MRPVSIVDRLGLNLVPFGEEYIGGCKKNPPPCAANMTTLKLDQTSAARKSKVEPQSCTRVRIRLAFLRWVALNETIID